MPSSFSWHCRKSLWAAPLLALLSLLPSGLARAATLTVTNTNDTGAGSLRAQVAAASSGDTITFAPGVTGIITLTSGEIAFGQGLTITGPGANVLAVSGGGSSRVLHVTGGTVAVSGLTIEDGLADFGGGLLVDDGAVSLTACAIVSNMATDGGGIENDGVLSGDSLTLNACTLSGNMAVNSDGGGGALINYGTAALTNCTLSGNSSIDLGGAVINNMMLGLTNCTVSNNTAGVADGGLSNADTAMVTSTILDGNTVGGAPDDVDEPVTSGGSNLIGADTSGSFTGAHDQNNVANPMLGPLASNGGQTQTMAPLFTSDVPSPAVDADYNTAVTVDQIGTVRPQGARNDIGAFEYVFQPPVATPDTYTNPPGQTLTVHAPGVLGNDTDAQGESLTAVLVSDVTNGQLMLSADGSFTYTPNPGYVGPDRFMYKAHAGTTGADSSVVSVTITNPGAPDTTAPTTTATPSGPQGASGWYKGPVSVTLAATDPDNDPNTLTTYYTTDGSTPTTTSPTYSQPISITGDGVHTLKFFSVDLAGNAEAVQTLVIKVDGTPPTLQFGAASPAPQPNAGGYVNGPVSIPYTAADATSGVASSTPGSPVRFTTEGAGQTQTVTVTDVAGNAAQFTTPAVSIDLTAPVTTGANQSVSGGQQVTLSATDNLSGVAPGSTVYSLDGGATQAYTGPFTVQTNGAHTVTFHSTDKAGNVEAEKTLTVTVNDQTPITTASLSGPPGLNGWYVGTVTVTLSARARSLLVAHTFYTLDGGSRQTYTQPFTVAGDAAHVLTFFSADTAGNQEPPNQQAVRIDGTAPTLAFGAPTPAPNAAGWNNTPVSVPYSGADATSGFAGALPGSPIRFPTEGKGQTKSVTAQDVAGNSASFTTPAVSIDMTPPVTTGSASGATVTFSATDSLSGVAQTVYAVDGGPAQTYTGPFAVTGAGSHTVTFHSMDVAGNAEAAHSLSVAGGVPTGKVLHTFSAGLQMIAVPEDYSKVGLGGAWDAGSAMLAVWNPSLVQYVLSPQSPADNLRPGQGYWVHLHSTTNLFDVGTPTPTNAPFTLNLAHGWNMIGDPFLSGVSLGGASVLNGAGTSLNLTDANHAGLIYPVFYSYPAGASQYQTTGASGSLTPYTGYWVYAFQACRLVLPAPGG